jgi:hypothetical protein
MAGHGVRKDSATRPSKFREETMRDAPSQKPPSMFIRFLAGPNRQNASVDHLMEEYHHVQSQPAPLTDTSRSASRATQLSGLTHHANNSISSNATVAASTQSRDSSIVRFSRTLASSINPVHMWQKVWRGSKDGAAAPRPSHEDELVQRQIRAEVAYANMKKEKEKQNNQNSLRSRTRSVDFAALSSRNTSLNSYSSNQRDSGIDMSEDRRRSLELPAASTTPFQRISSTPGRQKEKKKFHLRTPSLQELKRITSSSDLHRRAASSSNLLVETTAPAPAPSPAVEERSLAADELMTLRNAKSKKDLQRQVKLHKKVSDLENKLNLARRELEGLTDNAPDYRPKRVTSKRRFQPLPTLPSESLIVGDDDLPQTLASTLESLTDLANSPAKDHLDSVEVNDIAAPRPSLSEQRSVFESSSAEGSPEGGFLQALKKPKTLMRSASKADLDTDGHDWDLSPKRRISKRPRPKANSNSPTRLRFSISSPILSPTAQAIPLDANAAGVDIRSSLETVREREEESLAAMSFRVALETSPANPTRYAVPPRRHNRSLSPNKVVSRSVTQRAMPSSPSSPANHTPLRRSRSSSPPPSINFSRPTSPRKENSVVTARPNGVDIPDMPKSLGGPDVPRLAPKREQWEWPEDVF